MKIQLFGSARKSAGTVSADSAIMDSQPDTQDAAQPTHSRMQWLSAAAAALFSRKSGERGKTAASSPKAPPMARPATAAEVAKHAQERRAAEQPVKPPLTLEEMEAIERATLSVMQSLALVLDAHPNTRTVLRHLAMVETILIKSGFEEMSRLPMQLAARALEQLDVAAQGSDDEPLAALREALSDRCSGPIDEHKPEHDHRAAGISARARHPSGPMSGYGSLTLGRSSTTPARDDREAIESEQMHQDSLRRVSSGFGQPSDFAVGNRMHVAEGTISDFDALHAQFVGQEATSVQSETFGFSPTSTGPSPSEFLLDANPDDEILELEPRTNAGARNGR